MGGNDPAGGGNAILSTNLYDRAGGLLSRDTLTLCVPADAPCTAKFSTGALRDAYNVVVYQPDSRFWMFQAIETGIFVAFAALLLAVAVRRIRRHVI